MKKLLTIVALAGICNFAQARDSTHYSCAGFMNPNEPGPDNYGFTVLFDESRGPVIEKTGEQTRVETLTAVFAGTLYQNDVIQTEKYGQGTIKLIAPGKKNQVFFSGTYKLIQTDEATKLKLVGTINLVPSDSESTPEKINTVLDCVNLSN